MLNHSELRINAGFPLEHLMAPRIHPLLGCPSPCTGSVFIDHEGKLNLQIEERDPVTVTAENVSEVLHQLLTTWRNEVGLDRVFLL